MLLLWAFLLLGRVRTAEALRYQQPGEWGALLGLDRCPCARTLRRRTRQLASAEGLADWIGQLSQDWCADDPNAVATLYVDGHVQGLQRPWALAETLREPPAAGPAGRGQLLGACLGRDTAAVPAPPGGRGPGARDLAGIVPQLRQLALVPEGAGAADEPSLTLVFRPRGLEPGLVPGVAQSGHRGGELAQGQAGRTLAGERVRRDGHPVAHAAGRGHAGGPLGRAQGELGGALPRARDPFLGRASPARHGQGHSTRASRASWPGGRTRRNAQPALVTTHPSLAAAQVAGLLRSRWNQENFFKYMRSEFGLDSLPEHALVEVEPDTWVVNQAWRQIDKALKLQTLPTPLRMLMQTLRMLAYRAETAMAASLAPQMDNPETARSLLKALFRSDASLLPDAAAGTLTVRLLHQASRAQDTALAPLLAELNQTRTVFPGTDLRLVYELPPSDG